jgi:hypothetical protein
VIGRLLLLALAGTAVAAHQYGAYRWSTGTRELRARLSASRRAVQPPAVDFAELTPLPEPVQRYFRAALREGQPMVSVAHMRHRGTFNMGENEDRWKPFSSDQVVIVTPPGFDWDARIRVLPGLSARVHDAYVGGEGILHASMLGLVSITDQRGGGDLAEGELMRFFAEAAWYPTALLPSQGVEWTAVDGRSARATLTDGPIRLTMTFTFGEDSLIETVRAEARGRTVGGTTVQTPWEGRFWNYVERGGMRVPLEGEVAWLLPAGPKPYWRGRVQEIEFELARMSAISNRPGEFAGSVRP